MKSLNQSGIAPIIIVLALAAALVAAFSVNPGLLKGASIPGSSSFPLSSAMPTPTPTPSPTSKPTSTPTPTPSPTLKPTPIPTAVPTQAPAVNNTPPGAGFSRQTVSAAGQTFPVDIIAADLNSTKVIVDTASDSDCSNNCPTLSLADYVARNGAYAGINGAFFCPPDYSSCAGKTNSFDTLLMNKNKHYFNSDNNVYSTIPLAVFYPGGSRFVGRSEDWGRDTSPDAVIANYPLLVTGSNVVYTEAPNEPKFGQKGARGFIATKANMVYIGFVLNATMGESAQVMKAMGMGEALNLDEGGSTALYSGGYVLGPGRSLPDAVLFVRR